MVNRSILILKAKEPFREWILSLPESDDITLEEINQDSVAYMFPEYEDDDEREIFLKKIYKDLFEGQLGDWWRDDKDWPKTRSLSMFKKWFKLEFHSVVIDLVDDELISEDL